MTLLKYSAIFFMIGALSLCPSHAEVIGTTDQEVRTIAKPVLENMLEGFKTNNYATYSRDFDATLKEAMTEKKFHAIDGQIENSIGNCETTEYIGFLTKGKMTLILWKAKFDKSESDVLMKLVMSKRGDTYYVTGLWFE